MATYAIGDVQACYDELIQLLDAIHFDENHDQLWFAGDLVGRGPKPLETLRFIKNLKSPIVTLGNHDLHLLAVSAGAQKENAEDRFTDVLNAPDRDELVDWLRHQKFLHHDKTLDTLMVHAGLYPTWSIEEAKTYAKELETIFSGDRYKEILKYMYGNAPTIWDENLTGQVRHRFLINVFTRIRYCTQNFEMNFTEKTPMGQQPENLLPWFGLMKISGQLVFGHWAALEGKVNESQYPNLFALDTGCVWGGKLTAMRLEDQRRFSVTNVKS